MGVRQAEAVIWTEGLVAAMSDRSTLEFKSNIYPLSDEGQIINDRLFLVSISDPFALEALWRYNGTRGSKLNKLQKRQFGKGQHCSFAEAGDFPWGTRVIDGIPTVVCSCENWSCPRMHECRPDVEIPEIEQLEPELPAEEDSEALPQEVQDVPAPMDSHGKNEADGEEPPIGVEPGTTTEDEHESTGTATVEPDADEPADAGTPDYPADAETQTHYDEKQALIVEAEPSAWLYVTAGPGTGKTHTLIEKLKYMIDVQEVDPGPILVMSFTRAAVQVVKDRLQHAALKNEIENNWQAIDVTTFDKFCTRLLYWLKGNKPEWIGHQEISGMDYDHRIYAAAKQIREHPEIISQCRHLIVDETQDLVGPRAKLVLSMVESLPEGCGVTLLGDRCQSLYDYQVTVPAINSEAFYDSIREIGRFRSYTLEHNYRQNVCLPYSLDSLRHSILERDASSAGAQVAEILASLGEPERDLRKLDFSTLDKVSDGTLGILTRTNAKAIAISSLFYKHGIPHTLLRAEKEAFWSRIVADVLIDYPHETIDEDCFMSRAQEKGASSEKAIRAWIGLTTLRDARAEGARYKVENLLHAMAEEVVPESLAATKSMEPRITISTIHGAKGREFDRVWLMSEDLESASKSSELDEQKVAYVALSRARIETSLQKSEDGGLKIDKEGKRCYRTSARKKRVPNRPAKKRLTHIELINSTDIDQTTLLPAPELRSLAESGVLEGGEIRLCLPEKVPESGLVAYEIKTDDGILLGKMTPSFTSYYERYHEWAEGELPRFLPEAFDEIYIDRIISCVGKSARAPESARKFGDYAIWYGFTLGGFAHADNSQDH